MDPSNSGFATTEELKQFAEKYCGPMSNLDVNVLVETMAFSSQQGRAFLVQYRQMFEKNGLDSGPPEVKEQEGDPEKTQKITIYEVEIDE